VVGFDDEQSGVALAQQLLLEVRPVEIHLRETTPVDVVVLGVVFQPDELPEQP
jgi:hypothetical protein